VGEDFDPGPVREPFASLCRDYPGPEVYPPRDFRIEWGPVFHRGRLDRSARVLVLGQDPAQHEAITRRILVGEAGQRVQSFLAKLGIDRSYGMVNAFLYSVASQGGGSRHRGDPGIVAYRNRWLDALLIDTTVEAVVAFGSLAADAFERWRAGPGEGARTLPFAAVRHPTFPEGSSEDDEERKRRATREMLTGWNAALEELHPTLTHPDRAVALVPYDIEQPAEVAPIPACDLPAGLPAWMRSPEAWAIRRGEDWEEKRATIVVSVPAAARPW
jgi:hypothetical protein